MSFKSIGDLAISVLAKLEIEAGCEAADERASPRPSQIDTANRVARPAGVREGTNRTRHALAGSEEGGTIPPRNENGKGTASEPAAKLTLIVVKEPTRQLPRVLPVSKRMKVARPTGVAPRHAAFIRLVTVNGHLIQPSWKAS